MVWTPADIFHVSSPSWTLTFILLTDNALKTRVLPPMSQIYLTRKWKRLITLISKPNTVLWNVSIYNNLTQTRRTRHAFLNSKMLDIYHVLYWCYTYYNSIYGVKTAERTYNSVDSPRKCKYISSELTTG